jgi:hypothetical protein
MTEINLIGNDDAVVGSLAVNVSTATTQSNVIVNAARVRIGPSPDRAEVRKRIIFTTWLPGNPIVFLQPECSNTEHSDKFL